VKILVIDTSYIGDIAFLFPFFKSLKRIYDNPEITLLAKKIPSLLTEIIPYVDKTIIYEKKSSDKGILGFLKLKQKIDKYDIIFSPHRFGSSTAIVRFFFNNTKSIGFNWGINKTVFSKTVPFSDEIIFEERAGELLKPLNEQLVNEDFNINISEDWINVFNKKFPFAKNENYIFIIPGSQWDTKKWLLSYYAKISKWINEQNIKVYTAGAPSEMIMLEKLKEISGNIEVLNLELLDMLGFMYNSKLSIGGDTGPMHVMRMLGKKVVILFGPTADSLFLWHENQIPLFVKGLSCRPCHKHGPKKCPLGSLDCQFELKPEKVFETIMDIM